MDEGGYIPQLYSNATFRSIAESDMTERAHIHTHTHAQTYTSYTLTDHDCINIEIFTALFYYAFREAIQRYKLESVALFYF